MEDLGYFVASGITGNVLIYGNPSTGKTSTVTSMLTADGKSYVLVDCKAVVDHRLLVNKIYQRITGEVERFENVQDFIDNLKARDLDVVLILKNLQAVTLKNSSLDLFRWFDNIGVVGLQIYFIVSSASVPVGLLTSGIIKFYFENLNAAKVMQLLQQSDVLAPSTALKRNYIRLVVDTYYPFTTDIRELKSLIVRGWPKFVAPLTAEPGLDFVALFERYRPQLSEQFVAKEIAKIGSGDADAQFAQLSPLSSMLLAACYLASFNDPRYDFTIFSKLKEIRSGKRTFARRARNGNFKPLINSLRWFEFERAMSIMKSVCKDSEYYADRYLAIDLQTYTEFNNLVTLKLLLKNENKYKINCGFELVKKCCLLIGFEIESYLAE